MKNKKNSFASDSIFKNKGFYVALYSCIGVLLVGAIAVSYSMMNNLQRRELTQVDDIDFNSLQPTINSTTESYVFQQQELANNDSGNMEIGGISDFFKGDDEEENPEEEPQDTDENGVPQEESEVSTEIEEPIEADPVFNVFGENDVMMWPIVGEILMNYSTDSMVYDETLNQYRTNDTVNIAAEPGLQVRASADGIISSVSNTRRDGNQVTIDHGNGWTTTYSQLQDNILVSEGDVVLAGEVIGEVGSPSIFTSALGYNLGFKVAQGDRTVDPLQVLSESY